MIIGLFLRNYKCYRNINFIGFTKNIKHHLNLFIGPNGVGKSSILESINCVMNGVDAKEWSITSGQKIDRAEISPVFLIGRDDKFEHHQHIDAISDAFWNYDFTSVHKDDYCKEFIKFRNELKKTINPKDHWLISVGKNGLGEIQLSPFNQQVLNKTRRNGVSSAIVKKIIGYVYDRYRFVYIPVENKISDILSLQASEMQSLMDKSIVSEIKALLDKKEYTVGSAKKSVLGIINEKLDGYIDSINSDMDGTYIFKSKGGNSKRNIRPGDITDVIIKEFFSIRPLTKDGKHIKDLSSGQQRLALIDVATTFLSTKNDKEKEIILAIDEPESSLEASLRFRSFMKLIDVSEKYNRQLFITTHWYGSLLSSAHGTLHYIESKPTTQQGTAPEILQFPLNAVYEHRGDFPQSVEMKSYFDLVSSMNSLLKSPDNNWLICEGSEDALYLNTYLKKQLFNVNIMPFNGCGNIRKLYKLLSASMSDNTELKYLKGKVFCLIDTDTRNVIIENDYSPNTCLRFERISLADNSLSASTVSVRNPNGLQSEIEDILEPDIMWNTLNDLAKNDEKLSGLISLYTLNTKATYTGFSRGFPFLNKTSLDSHEQLDELKTYLDSTVMKAKIAHRYCELVSSKNRNLSLLWMKPILMHFNTNEYAKK
ncbi:ATP-dependent nuclease [Aeromonas hydrophila]|uniref:ATP-dependent nuclease n=1 Tax=Aeromonas hydrophila TaxID=644 RepID=UPI0009B88949|nr:ATP-binding protein [Aeromonas hydrophila]